MPFFGNRRKLCDFAKKKVAWIYKNVSCLCASYGLNFSLKCSFKSILAKKHQKFSLCMPYKKHLSKYPYSEKPSLPWRLSGCTPEEEPKIKLRILYDMFRTENCNQSFPSWKISLDRTGLSLNWCLFI